MIMGRQNNKESGEFPPRSDCQYRCWHPKACQTSNGPEPDAGQPCIFPFIYANKYHHHYTYLLYEGMGYWCATNAKEDICDSHRKNYLESGEWVQKRRTTTPATSTTTTTTDYLDEDRESSSKPVYWQICLVYLFVLLTIRY